MGGLPMPASWTFTYLGSPENSLSTEVSPGVVVLDPFSSESDFTCERNPNFSSAMLMSAAPVFVGVSSLAVRTVMLMGLPFGASARVDVSEVERVGLGQIAHFELYQDSL